MRRSLSPGRVLPAVCAVAALGLVLRIVYLLVFVEDSSLVGDGLEYHGLANGLADGRGFVNPFAEPGQTAQPTAHKPPLYPLLLATTSVVGAHRPRAAPDRVGGGRDRHGAGLRAARPPARRPARGADRGVHRRRLPGVPRGRRIPARRVPVRVPASPSRCWPPTGRGSEPGTWRLAQLGACDRAGQPHPQRGHRAPGATGPARGLAPGPAGTRHARGRGRGRLRDRARPVADPVLDRLRRAGRHLHQLRGPAGRSQLRRHLQRHEHRRLVVRVRPGRDGRHRGGGRAAAAGTGACATPATTPSGCRRWSPPAR